MLTLFCDNICHFYTNFHQRVPDKITVLLGCLFVPFLAWCPRFMPICSICSCIDGQKLAQILSVYAKTSPAVGAPPRTALGELTLLPRLLSRTPDGSHLWRSHRTICAFSACPGLQCPNYGYLTPM